MVYFCADDYGISACGNSRIENCLTNGILNKVSVLPNGELTDFKNHLINSNTKLSLHINLVEGRPLSESEDVRLLITSDGYFKYSFVGLLLLSLSPKRKEFEKQLYKEIQSQFRFWKTEICENSELSVDSHQHTHMIPLVFKTLMRVIKDENLNVTSVRVPDEPITPYILTPSLYFKYSLTGLIKQWLLKILAFFNRNKLREAKINPAYFMGVMFSGKLNEEMVKKLLPKYVKLAEKNNRDIEIGFHPGYIKRSETLIDGNRKGFNKFYYSDWRNIEYNTLLNMKLN